MSRSNSFVEMNNSFVVEENVKKSLLVKVENDLDKEDKLLVGEDP